MSGRQYNKIAAGVLLAGLIAMVTGKVVDILYKPNLHPAQRGYNAYAASPDEPAPVAQPVAEFSIDIKALMQQASAEAGKSLFVKCVSCHTDSKAGPNRVGPNLWNIVGHVKAAHEGYNYSSALKNLGGTWDYNDLAHFIHKPSQYAKGTKMSFAGIAKPEDIANIIAYLRSLSDSPKPLP